MEKSTISAGKRPKNPLRKRVLKDLRRDWKRYLMIFAVMLVTIGFVSGMYVANNSMEASLNSCAERFHREDGHFILSKRADDALIEALEAGEQADVPAVFRDRAYEEIEETVEEKAAEALEESVREQVREAITAQAKAAAAASGK